METKAVETKAVETITLTFGDCGENHVGMQKIGCREECGFSVADLHNYRDFFSEAGLECELYELGEECRIRGEASFGEASFGEASFGEASILIIRNCLDIFMCEIDKTVDDLLKEQKALNWDKKAFMRGRVVNKNARHNLCYADEGQEPDYEERKGRIVSFGEIPLTRHVKDKLESIFGKKLIGEGNRYYDVRKCGIGYHGDTERRIVIGCRLGADMPLHFNWYHETKPVGANFGVVLKHGDVYVMSEKAVGFDWKRRTLYTLRHSAGCEKYTKIK
jgi:hypothetical protein